MAGTATATPPPSAASSHTLSLYQKPRTNRTTIFVPQPWSWTASSGSKKPTRKRTRRANLMVFAETAQEPSGGGSTEQQKPRAPSSGFDTRIHWDNEDEGWIGGKSTKSDPGSDGEGVEENEDDILGRRFSDLLYNSSDSHYQFLGIAPDADLEEIKSAYRRLSKEYHPDTTTLPLRSASEMFMKLRDIYNVLSDDEKRRFYDWTLAQEAASKEAEKMRVRLEDPYMKEVENYVPVPDMVDRLGGKNMALSDQAMSALTFDVLIVVFAIGCIVFVAFFKDAYDY